MDTNTKKYQKPIGGYILFNLLQDRKGGIAQTQIQFYSIRSPTHTKTGIKRTVESTE